LLSARTARMNFGDFLEARGGSEGPIPKGWLRIAELRTHSMGFGTPEAVREDSRWSSASGATGVVAKNVAARKPPDRITARDASRQGCRIRCDESKNASQPYRGAVFVRAVTGGVRAASFFATTPVALEALDHRLLAR